MQLFFRRTFNFIFSNHFQSCFSPFPKYCYQKEIAENHSLHLLLSFPVLADLLIVRSRGLCTKSQKKLVLGRFSSTKKASLIWDDLQRPPGLLKRGQNLNSIKMQHSVCCSYYYVLNWGLLKLFLASFQMLLQWHTYFHKQTALLHILRKTLTDDFKTRGFAPGPNK